MFWLLFPAALLESFSRTGPDNEKRMEEFLSEWLGRKRKGFLPRKRNFHLCQQDVNERRKKSAKRNKQKIIQVPSNPKAQGFRAPESSLILCC